MHERRRNSKWLPEFFLLLQTIAMLLFTYISYGVLINFKMPQVPLLLLFAVANAFYIIKFYLRFIEIKERTKYMNYTSPTS